MALITFAPHGFDPALSISTAFTGASLTSRSAVECVFTNPSTNGSQGYVFKLKGTGFAFNGDSATAGVIKSVEIYDAQGNLSVTMLPGGTGFGNNSLRDFIVTLSTQGHAQALLILLSSADTVNGSEGADQLHSFGGSDTVDKLDGKGGDDRLNSTTPGTTTKVALDGGAGEDLLVMQRSNNVAFVLDLTNPARKQTLVDGSSIVNVERITITTTGAGNDSITGGALDDQITSFAGEDRFNGGGGNDVLQSSGNSTVLGGAGDDRLVNVPGFLTTTTSVLMDGGAGIDTGVIVRFAENLAINLNISNPNVQQTLADGTRLIRIEQVELVSGDLNDRFIGGSGNDKFQAGAGNDVFNGGVGDDFVFGDDGTDTLDGGAGSDTVSFLFTDDALLLTLNGATTVTAKIGGLASDRLRNFENVEGGDGNDTINGDGLDNILDGDLGTDTLRGFAGNDTLISEEAGDKLDGGAGTADLAVLGRRSSTVNLIVSAATPAAQQNLGDGTTLTGCERSSVTAGSGNDRLTGGALDDFFSGGAGNDTLAGGGGFDMASFAEKTVSVAVTLTGASAASVRIGGVVEDRISGIEALTSGSGSDTIVGDASANSFDGKAGSDKLDGRGGNDTIFGGVVGFATGYPDRDTLTGGAGNDVLDGGGDVDTASYAEKTVRIAVTLAGNDIATVTVGGVAEDTIVNIENITGGSANDVVNGDGRSNSFIGNAGNDALSGFGAIDRLSGDAGNDTLSGGVGEDVLIGGAGVDRLVGGTGRDTAVFAIAAWGGDVFADFQDGMDRLQFRRSIADDVSDFAITGNGTKSVALAIGAQSLTLHSSTIITLTNADFQFLA